MRSGRARRAILLGVVVAMVGTLGVAPAAADGVVTERVSVTSGGAGGDGYSLFAAISGDGRYVAYESWSTNLVTGDTNGTADVFVYDRQTGAVERVSVASGGTQGDGPSLHPSLSSDGRYVAFESSATNLVPGDTNGVSDVFVYDRQTDTVERVSVATGGTESNGPARFPSISADGRFVTFESSASNLVPGDTNNSTDVFVYDRQTDTIERVSVATGGTQGNASSVLPTISDDGRYVAFDSWASNLVSGDTNGVRDVFVYDRQTDTIERISVSSGGTQGDGDSLFGVISGDGRFVAFESLASNLVPGDTNGVKDVFVYDRQTDTVERVSVAADGTEGDGSSQDPSISGDGRFVAFDSYASNLVPGDGGRRDVFVYDRGANVIERISIASDGTEGNADSLAASLSDDGRFVAYDTFASNLVPDDTNGEGDVLLGQAFAVIRLWAADRYGTAAAVSRYFFPDGASTVFIATGLNFPDALAAGPAAAAASAPVLLVRTDAVPSATLNELVRLAPTKVVIVGGTGVISSAVEAALAALPSNPTVERWWGVDRYGTAAAVAAGQWPGGADTVYLATGDNYPDALAGAPAAGSIPGPLLLTRRDVVPGVTRQALSDLGASTVVLLGGTGVISSAVEADLAGTYTVVRRAGADRYATAADVSANTFATADEVLVATGLDYPDALAGGPPGGLGSRPVLLIRPDSIPGATASELGRLRPIRIFILGGPGVVSDSIGDTLHAYLAP